jgi:Subtilase family
MKRGDHGRLMVDPARSARRWRPRSRRAAAALACLLAAVACAACASQALAVFPLLGNGNLAEPSTWKLAPGETLTNVGGAEKQHYAATPQEPPAGEPTEAAEIEKLNGQEDELCGVMGMSITDAHATMPSGTGSCIAAGAPIHTAMQVTVGRPDVGIAELDSGIEWNNSGAMLVLRGKYLINPGELPAPKVDMSKTFDPSTHVNCETARAATGGDFNPDGGMPGGTPGGSGPIPYDVLEQGVFNTLDYACDSRVANVVEHYPQCSNPPSTKECRNGPPGMLTPEDLIIAFSDGIDHDKNGYVNDIAGWNYVDNNNDPYAEVHFGHGTGEELDSAGEADNAAGPAGACPNCEVMELRVGESFIADATRFASAVLYATDRGIDVIQEPLGTYNAPIYTREAINYAYDHGTTIIASAADEAAEHHNLPAVLPHMVVVNSVRGPESVAGSGKASLNTSHPPSWLQFDGCTNFGPRIDIAVSSNRCSSEATGKGAGVAGLIYSAALNACGAGLYGACSGGKLAAARDCTRPTGEACAITPNEVQQLMASGNIAGTMVNGSSQLGSKAPSAGKKPADEGEGGQADDVNAALSPESACSVGMAPTCTDPNLNTTFAADQNGGVVGTLPDTFLYPSRKGFDEFFGYGRLNAYKSVGAAAEGWIPPEADITSPEWFQQLDPSKSSFNVEGYVNARESYTCRVEVAPGAQPNNRSTTAGGDFAPVPSSFCDGKTSHSSSFTGVLASVSAPALEAMFPKEDPAGFTGNENGGGANKQTSNGRPNTLPYAFTLRVVVSTAAADAGPAMTGEDRRQLFLHRDAEMLKGFPLDIKGDGDASPLLVDLAGNNTNQLIVANSNGWIHAYQYNPLTGGVSELPGWPVHTKMLPLHTGEHAFTSGGLTTAQYDPILEAPATGDLTGDGEMDIVADDLQGNVYAWNSKGQLIFHQTSNPVYSGAPLSGNPSWDAERKGVRDRTEVGLITSPILADLEPEKGPGLDIIAAGEDRHLYAWHPSGEAVNGFPVLVEDPDKVASVDPTSNEPTFNSNAKSNPGEDEDQGKIVDTPAVANLDGPGKPPTIIVGTNEEYLAETGDEGPINASPATTSSLAAFEAAGLLNFANSRLYAIKASGCSSEPGTCATGGFKCEASTCSSVAFREGWPVKIGLLDAGLNPEVGEGIDGSPVVAPLTCSQGGEGLKIGVTPDLGPGYVLNANGSSCYGSTSGKYNAVSTEFSAGNGKTDTPAFPIVGEPSFGTLDGTTISFFAPAAGLIRLLDIEAPDYQKGGQDFIGGWNANSGQFDPGFPAVDNDLGFITAQTVGDVTGEAPKQEVLGGTASNDLEAYNLEGTPASNAWPKLTGGWMVATPTLGSLGTLDTSSEAKKDVVSITREGVVSVYSTPASACSPSSWPNFHHDIANSGDYTRDAIAPGHPLHASVAESTLSWTAPGGDLMCGTATSYQVVTSATPITAENFAAATPVSGAPAPAAAGTAQSFKLPAGTKAYVAIRAIDEQGNIGLPAIAEFNSGAPLPAIGRCEFVGSGGEWRGEHCTYEAHGKGKYNFLAGAGPKKKITGTLGAATLETVAKVKVTCAGGSTAGEYIGVHTETLTLTLTGCKRASSGESCQSLAAGAGEIVTSALEGEVGFISGRATKKPVIGLDLKHEGAIITAECGAGLSRAVLTVEGSAIATVTKTALMTLEETLKFKATAGLQEPEHFEEGVKDTLLETLVAGTEKTTEQAGLTVTALDKSEEPIEIKTRVV